MENTENTQLVSDDLLAELEALKPNKTPPPSVYVTGNKRLIDAMRNRAGSDNQN